MVQRSCADEKAEVTPRQLDSGRSQSDVEEFVGYIMVDDEFLVQLLPPAAGVHPMTGEGYDVASHHIVVGNGQGGKERVIALPLYVKLPCSDMCML